MPIDPITGMMVVGAGSQIVGGVMSYQERQKAERARQKLANKIRAMIDKNFKIPEADMAPLTAEEYQLVGRLDPEAAQYVQEKAPQLLQETPVSQTARKAQLDALRQMQAVASGVDPIARAQQEQAIQAGEAAGTRARLQQLRNLASSGMLTGGGRAVAETEAAGEQIGQTRRALMDSAAQQRARQIDAIRAAAQMGGQIRGPEMSRERTNIDAMNDFNRRVATTRQAKLNEVARMRNQAQQYNLQQRQSVADKRTQLRNFLSQYNKEWQARQQQQQADYANRKLGMQIDAAQASGPSYTPSGAGAVVEALGKPALQVGTQKFVEGLAPAAPLTDEDDRVAPAVPIVGEY